MNISEFSKCSNCGACYNICPKNALSLDDTGVFYQVKVDEALCVDCGLCVKVCPVNNATDSKRPIYACAGWSTDSKLVLNSSSGGMFYALSQKIVSDGGVVFAAVYSDDCKSVKFASSDDVDLSKMRKSKYVESVVGDSFRAIRDELLKNRKVLFCGTPCQAAGLVEFLGRDYENLIVCDFACGGLPSHQIYKRYLEELEKRYRKPVKSVDFRPKTHGWKRYAMKIIFENGRVYNRLGIEDEYLRSFLQGQYTVRDYCLECKFSDSHSSDITLADFWLHEKLSSLQSEDGISLILCNSEKGKYLIDSIGDIFELTELDVNSASYNNKKRELNEDKKVKHSAFLQFYSEHGLKAASYKFIPLSLTKKVKSRIAAFVYRRRTK